MFHGFSYFFIEWEAYSENVAEVIKLKSNMLFKNIQLKINIKYLINCYKTILITSGTFRIEMFKKTLMVC